MLHFAASELGLHCLHNTPKGIADLKRVKVKNGNLPLLLVPSWPRILLADFILDDESETVIIILKIN